MPNSMNKYSSLAMSCVWIRSFIASMFIITTTAAGASEYATTMPVSGESHHLAAAAFDQQMLQLLSKHQIPGASVAIIVDDQLQVARGYGWANIEAREAMQPWHVLRIASISKTITAIGVLRLIEQQQVKLDDSILSYLKLPLPTGKRLAVGVDQITVRHLLQMSSGWYTDRPQDYDVLLGPWSPSMLHTLKNKIPPDCSLAAQYMQTVPLQYTPGTRYSYGNINYCLLGLLINSVTDKPGVTGYEEYIQKNILKPLGLVQMRIGATTEAQRADQEAKYYFFNESNEDIRHKIDRLLDGLPYGNTDILCKNAADGGWITSASDLAHLFHALARGKILNRVTLQQMRQTYTFNNTPKVLHAFGWDQVKTYHDQRYYYKTGSLTGTQALVIMREDGNVYVALFNAKPKQQKEFLAELETLLVHF